MRLQFVIGILIYLEDYIVKTSDATVFLHQLTWNDANSFCKDIGKNLVTINSQRKNVILKKEVGIALFSSGVTEFWIGLHAIDPNDFAIMRWASDCTFSVDYVNWDTSVNHNSIDLCAYAVVSFSAMVWQLSNCNSTQKPFICEDDRTSVDVCSSHFYEVFNDRKGDEPRGTGLAEGTATVPLCTELCEDIASTGFCWGFLFNTVTFKCKPYNIVDDPFSNDPYMSAVENGRDTHIRRCNFTVTTNSATLTPLVYNTCGKVVVSQCTCSDGTTEAVTMTTTQTTQNIITSQESQDLSTYGLNTPPITTNPTSESTITTELQIFTSTNATTVTQSYCQCPCENTSKPPKDSIDDIMRKIKIDPKKTSAALRKLNSARDDRISATGIGYTAIVVLSLVAGLIIFLDFKLLQRDVYKLCRNIFK